MTAELSIRRYEPADAEAVWTVHERALRASPIEFVEDAPADDDLRAIADEYLDAGGEFLVGTVDGDVVAVGGFLPAEPDEVTAAGGDPDPENGADGHSGATEAAELLRMRVHPAHQREGYATALLSKLEARAAEQGFDRIVLETHERLRAARALYEASGYEPTGSNPHPVTDDRILHYRKEL